MICLMSLVYADSIMVLEPFLMGGTAEIVDASIYSEHVRHILGKNIHPDWDVLTKAQMHHLMSESNKDLLNAAPIELAKNFGADWLVTTELFQLSNQKGIQIWFREVEANKVIHEARLVADDWTNLHSSIETNWEEIIPKGWGVSSTILTISPLNNELYRCLKHSIVTKLTEPTFVIDAQTSPTSSIYMPSSIGRIQWNVGGIKQQVTWTSFGSKPELAIENAMRFRQMKGTTIEDICQSIIQQTILVQGK